MQQLILAPQQRASQQVPYMMYESVLICVITHKVYRRGMSDEHKSIYSQPADYDTICQHHR